MEDFTPSENFEAAKAAFEAAATQNGIELEWSSRYKKPRGSTTVATGTTCSLIFLALLIPAAALARIAVRVFLALSGLG